MKISVLFKEEVRRLDDRYIAGCERVFVSDVKYLTSLGYLNNAFTAASNNKIQFLNKKIHKIAYPHDLISRISKLLIRLHIHGKIFYWILSSSKLLLQLYYSVVFLLNEYKSDIFYTYQVPLVGLFFPKKTVVTYHNFCTDLNIYFRLLFLLQKNASTIRYIFVSKSLYKEFIEAYPILKKCKCFVLHNSVNTNIFKNRTKSLNIINIIFLSAWVEDKGIYYLPEIINKVNLVYKNKVKFIIGGSLRLWSLPEEEYQKYRHIAKQINKLKYTFSNVEVIGAVEYKKVPDLLNKATFTLLPSIWEEPYSLLAIESLSSGTPVIAFKVGGNKEIISNKTNGHLVSTPSPSEMSRLIINIIKDFKVNDYKKMSHAARLSAARYTVDDRNMRLKNILLNGLGA